MAKTKYIDFIGKAQWAKLREEDRDLGQNLPEGSDQRVKLEACQGMYVMNVIIDAATKKQMIADGVPNKGMTGQLFKEDDEDNKFYKCTRRHFNPKFKDKDTGEEGVVVGAPKVFKEVDGANVAWDFEEDGLIGNDSVVKVRLAVSELSNGGYISEMIAVKVLEHVVYEGSSGGFDDM